MKQIDIDITKLNFLTRQQAAIYANVSTDTIDSWITKGYIEKIKPNPRKNGKVLIPRKSVDRFLNSFLNKGETAHE